MPVWSVVRRAFVSEVRYVVPVFVKSVVDACVKKVEEAMSPAFLIQSPVVVELTPTPAYESMVHGQVIPVPVSEIGDVPRTLNVLHVREPPHVTDVVATVESEFAPVQYARFPMTGAEEVPMPR